MKKFRLKSRVVLVIVLTVLLVMLTFVSSTFSWYTRVQSAVTLSGNGLAYNPSVDCYDGTGVTHSTMRSSTGLEDSYTTSGVYYASHTLAPGARDYYRTTLTNTTGSDQYVSLYLSGLQTTTGTGELCVGVNSPVKSYKNYSVRAAAQTATSATTAATNTMRVYFQPKDDASWQGGNYNICYTTGSTALTLSGSTSNGTYKAFTLSPTAGTFFVDIPSNTNQFFIAVKDFSQSYQHTQFLTCSSIGLTSTQSVVCYLENDYSGGYNEAQARTGTVSGANVINRYSGITIRNGNSMPISLKSGTDYIGSVTYTSSNTNVFTVANGKLTAKGVGTATLTMKTKGKDYSDEQTSNYNSQTYSCTVTVTSANTSTFTKDDAPVLQNILVPAASGGINGETVVDWFIMNDKNASGNVTFKFSSFYVGV